MAKLVASEAAVYVTDEANPDPRPATAIPVTTPVERMHKGREDLHDLRGHQ